MCHVVPVRAGANATHLPRKAGETVFSSQKIFAEGATAVIGLLDVCALRWLIKSPGRSLATEVRQPYSISVKEESVLI